MGNLDSVPLGGLWETLWNTPQIWPTEGWGSWASCFPPPISRWWRVAPGALVIQHFQPAPCRDQTCCWDGKCSPTQMQEAAVCMETIWGTCRGAEKIWVGTTHICSAPLPHLNHKGLLYLLYTSVSCVHLSKCPELYKIEKSLSPRNF